MAKQRQLTLVWPIRGLDKVASYEKQPPFSTPDALNVWTDDRSENRERGGSRPGLGKAFATQLGGGNPVRLLESVQYVDNDTQTTKVVASSNGALYYENGSVLTQVSTEIALATDRLLTGQNYFSKLYIGDYGPVISGEDGIVNGKVFTTAASTSLSSINAKDYCVLIKQRGSSASEEEQMITISGTPTGGTFQLFFQNYSTVELAYNATSQAIKLALEDLPAIGTGNVQVTGSTIAAAPIRVKFINDLANEFQRSISADGSNLTGGGTNEVQSISVSGASGSTFALKVNIGANSEITTDIAHDASAADVLAALQALTIIENPSDVTTGGGALGTNPVTVTFQNNLGSKDITLMATYRLALSGSGSEAVAVSTTTAGASLSIDVNSLTSGGRGGARPGCYEIESVVGNVVNLKHVAAPNGNSVDVPYRIERTTKVYDPKKQTVEPLFQTAGKGIVPTNCRIISGWRGRLICVEDADPHNIKMSRVFNPFDWNYFADDQARPIMGNLSFAGGIGEPITALIPFHQNCLIIGCAGSLWALNSDPGSGGTIKRLSHEIGILDKRAWCVIKGGYLMIMTRDGIYVMPPGCGQNPVSVSRELLPKELLNIDTSEYTVTMSYDMRFRGVHLFLYNASNTYHWFIDIHTREKAGQFGAAFWPVAYQSDHVASVTHARIKHTGTSSNVICGGHDGYVRNLQQVLDQDDGTAIPSHIVYGPFALGSRDGFTEGKLTQIAAVLGRGSGNVTWSVHVGKTAEDAVNAAARETGTWSASSTAGLQYKAHPRARGSFATIKLTSTGA